MTAVVLLQLPQIKADTEGAGARSYNYRVVMYSGGAELDMRGRCSAGQRARPIIAHPHTGALTHRSLGSCEEHRIQFMLAVLQRNAGSSCESAVVFHLQTTSIMNGTASSFNYATTDQAA